MILEAIISVTSGKRKKVRKRREMRLGKAVEKERGGKRKKGWCRGGGG